MRSERFAHIPGALALATSKRSFTFAGAAPSVFMDAPIKATGAVAHRERSGRSSRAAGALLRHAPNGSTFARDSPRGRSCHGPEVRHRRVQGDGHPDREAARAGPGQLTGSVNWSTSVIGRQAGRTTGRPRARAASARRSSYVTKASISDPNSSAVARWIASSVRSSVGPTDAARSATR